MAHPVLTGVAARRGSATLSRRALAAFLLPALALYSVFVLWPIAQSLRYSLFDWNGLGRVDKFVGLQNFRDAFGDPDFREAFGNNVFIIVFSLVLQLPFALFLAVLLNQRLRGRAVLRVLFFAPYILSEVVTAVVWRQILRPRGLLDAMLDGVGLSSLKHEWLADPDFVMNSMFFVVSWKYFGLHMILLLAGLQQISHGLTDAARTDGATSWQVFRHITLPLLAPTIRVSVFLSVIGALQLFDLVYVTTKGGPVGRSATMATYLIEKFQRGQFGYASAISVVIFMICLVIALLYQRFALRRDLRGAYG